MKVTAFLKKGLTKVEAALKSELAREGPLRKPLEEVVFSGGKRLRPALVLLCSGALEDKVVRAAAGAEMIHAGSLIHDDIIDEADTRRGVRSLHKAWGLTIAVAAGDYLFARAFASLASTGDIRASNSMARVITEMSKGEFLNLDKKISYWNEETYGDYIYQKTSCLFGACCRVGAELGKNPEDAGTLEEIGTLLGNAFQLWDDILDLESDKEVLGKPAQSDLEDGKVTLPYILARELPGSDVISRAMERDEPELYREAAAFVRESGALETAKRRADGIFDKVSLLSNGLADPMARQGIIMITERLKNRKS